MATTRKRNVEIDVVVDDKTASAKLKNIGNAAGQTGGKFSSLSGHAKLLAGGLGLVAGSQVVNFLSDAATAAMEDEAAQKQLALALKNTVGATDSQVAATEEFIEQTMRATGVADDELRPALAELVRTTGNLETAQSVLGVAMDIAAAKGLSLETVTKAMGKAALGNVGALGRLGIATKDAKGEVMDFDEVLQEASRTMGGATEEALLTTEGQVRAAKTQWAEFTEELGRGVIQGLMKVGREFGIIDEEWQVAAASMRREMDKNRHPIARITTAVEDQAASYDELAGEIKGAADEQRAAADPAFNVLKTQRDLAKATEAYNEALAVSGPKSRDTMNAALDLAEAQSDANVAAKTFATSGGAQSIQAFEDMLREAGLAEKQIRDIIQAIKDLNKTPVKNPIRVDRHGDVITRAGPRAAGGPVSPHGTYVVGEKGPELLEMGAQGGNIVPNHALGGGGNSYTINVNAGVGADKAAIGQAVVSAIKAYEKRNGNRWRT